MIKIGIAGACGRMGQRIGVLAAADKELKIAGALERGDHPACGRDYGELLGLGSLGVKVQKDPKAVLAQVDVLVDFAVGSAVLNHVEAARTAGKPVVIGTTGLSETDFQFIREAAKSIACVQSPNMSPGVNVLLELIGAVAKSLGGGYDIEIVEAHHRMKKDAPSGTAIALAHAISKAVHREISKDGRARTSNEIVVHALRGGDIVGDHTITYAGGGEMVSISHRATSRDTFAVGALRAAKFVVHAKPGLYSMLDVMKGECHGR